MSVLNDGPRWAFYIREFLIPAVDFYQRIVTEKFLPSISEEVINKEAEEASQQSFERLGKGIDPEYYDPGDYVDQAQNDGLIFYEFMRDTKQGTVNALTAALYHLFEQQVCHFYRLVAWDREAVFRNGQEAVDKLKALGIDFAQFPEWQAINELRLVANAIKHAEGGSLKALATVRPDLLERPSIGPNFPGPRPFVEQPLSGDGVYFTEGEFATKSKDIKTLWEKIASLIDQ